jgi:hypothetical protein
MIREAVTSTKRSGNETSGEFLKRMGSLERTRISLAHQTFYCSTTISFSKLDHYSRFARSMDGVHINVGAPYPRKMDMGEFFYNGFGQVGPALPSTYACLWTRIKARTEHSAAEQTFDALNKFLAICNFLLSRKAIHTGRRRPWNMILLGPFQMLHDSNKSRIDRLWYNESYVDGSFPHALQQGRVRFLESMDKTIRRISESKVADLIWQSLLQLQSAGETADRSAALLKLWSTLEILTGSTKERNDTTVRRGAFLAREPELWLEKLKHAADIRNRIVHLGEQNRYLDYVVPDLFEYVGGILRVLIYAKRSFSSSSEFIEMLDHAPEVTEIKRRINVSKLALRLRA